MDIPGGSGGPYVILVYRRMQKVLSCSIKKGNKHFFKREKFFNCVEERKNQDRKSYLVRGLGIDVVEERSIRLVRILLHCGVFPLFMV